MFDWSRLLCSDHWHVYISYYFHTTRNCSLTIHIIMLRTYTPLIRIKYNIRISVLLESGGCCSYISIDVLSAVRGPCHLKPT